MWREFHSCDSTAFWCDYRCWKSKEKCLSSDTNEQTQHKQWSQIFHTANANHTYWCCTFTSTAINNLQVSQRHCVISRCCQTDQANAMMVYLKQKNCPRCIWMCNVASHNFSGGLCHEWPWHSLGCKSCSSKSAIVCRIYTLHLKHPGFWSISEKSSSVKKRFI